MTAGPSTLEEGLSRQQRQVGGLASKFIGKPGSTHGAVKDEGRNGGEDKPKECKPGGLKKKREGAGRQFKSRVRDSQLLKKEAPENKGGKTVRINGRTGLLRIAQKINDRALKKKTKV